MSKSNSDRLSDVEKKLSLMGDIDGRVGKMLVDVRQARRKAGIELLKVTVMTELSAYAAAGNAPDTSRLLLIDAVMWCWDNQAEEFWRSNRDIKVDDWLDRVISAYSRAGMH